MTPLRINLAGACYHVYNRGNHRDQIFFSDEDYELFLSLLFIYCNKYNVKLISYSLMKNHFHLFINTTEDNLSDFMQSFSSIFVMKYNTLNDFVGHLFQDRFKSEIVDSTGYACSLARYIHLNIVNTKEYVDASTEDKINLLNSFKWSSLYYYFNPSKAAKIPCLDCGQVLKYYGNNVYEQVDCYKQNIIQNLELSGEDVKSAIFDNIIAGSVIGSQKYADSLKAKIKVNEINNPKAKNIKSISPEKLESKFIENLLIDKEQLHLKNSRCCLLRDSIIYLATQLSVGKTTMQKIGEYFGHISGSAVSKVERKMQRLLETDGNIRNAIINLQICIETDNLELLRLVDISVLKRYSSFA